jgi:16S rRNA (guanine527-N7)-methyltransferase
VQVKVVQDMVSALGLQNVRCRQARVEDIREQFDYVTGRSVTAMPRFVEWVENKLIAPVLPPDDGLDSGSSGVANGILYIKGGISEEQTEDLGGLEPTQVFQISELVGGGVYEGDKAVVYFAASDLRRGVKRRADESGRDSKRPHRSGRMASGR